MDLFYHEDTDIDLLSTQLPGCGCIGNCTSKIVCCCLAQSGSSYDEHGRLSDFSSPIFECNSECLCNTLCRNRVVQKFLNSNPEFLYECYNCSPIGKGVKSLRNFEKGDLVCVYLGEVIPPNEVFQRESNQLLLYGRNYVLVMREYIRDKLMYQTCVDGLGNSGDLAKPISRLINHSCSPNLEVVPVRIDNPIPYLALFANQYIDAGCELFYDYGQSVPDEHMHLSKTPCLCHSFKCRKYLPRVFS